MWGFRLNERQRKRAQPSEETDGFRIGQRGPGGHGNIRRRRDGGDLRQCASCGCSVPANGWETHVNGIRHRRNLASIALVGEPGHLVRTIFEPDPEDVPDTYRSNDPVARRAQQLRQLTVSASDDNSAGLQLQCLEPAGPRNPHQYHHDHISDERCSGGGPQSTQPRIAAASATTATAGPSSANQSQSQRRPSGSQPGQLDPSRKGPPPRRLRPHSEAFAELQARREQRMLGGGAAAAAGPLQNSPPSPRSLSNSGDAQTSDSPDSIPGTASSSDEDTAPPRRGASGLLGRWSRPPRLPPPAPPPPAGYPPRRCRQPRLEAAAAAASAVVAWSPDIAQVAALEAAARREAVHHTGLGPLYQATLRLLDAAALRRGVAELQERLRRYIRHLAAWQQQPQQSGEQASALATVGIGINGSDAAGDIELSDGGGLGSEDEKEEDMEEEEALIGEETRMMAAAPPPPTPSAQRRRRPLPRPYLRLGPVELLLLSIHPAVMATAERHKTESAAGAAAVTATSRDCTPGRNAGAAGCGPKHAPGASMLRDASAVVTDEPAVVAAAAASASPGFSFRTSSSSQPAAQGQGPGRIRQKQQQQDQQQQQLYQQQPQYVMMKSLRKGGGSRGLSTGDGGGDALQSLPVAPPPSPSPSLLLPHLFLEVPFKPYGREAAAYATAMGVLLAALRRKGREGASCLESFGLRFSREDYLEVLAQGGAARMAPLGALWQLVPALVQLVQARPGWLHELRLCVPPGLLDVEQMECLQRATVDPGARNERRLAALMGTHCRLGASSLIRTLPVEVLELVLDKALPRRPCRLVLGISNWLPGPQQSRGLRRRRVAAGAAAAAAIWAGPGLEPPPAAPPHVIPGGGAAAQQQQQHHQQQLLMPLDVRVAARHAARL